MTSPIRTAAPETAMNDATLNRTFADLLAGWTNAIATKDHPWYERHLAEDFYGTSHPWPTLTLDKARMIALDNAIDIMEAEWVDVEARRFGDIVLVSGYVRYTREVFAPGAQIGEGMPDGEQIGGFVSGHVVLYVNAWRHNGGDWQCFDQHQVGYIKDAG